jgi:antitoxin (DNA-binding transcriptional repressor) of toxin-antitoxin stability system
MAGCNPLFADRYGGWYKGTMGQHSIKDASNHLHELVERAAQGELIVLTRDGKPIAEIKALDTEAKILTDAKLDWLENVIASPLAKTKSAVDLIREVRSDWALA